MNLLRYPKHLRRKLAVYCSSCMEETEEVQCCEDIADFCYGRPATQHHYYSGSACCGEACLTYAEWVQGRWEDRCRMVTITTLYPKLERRAA